MSAISLACNFEICHLKGLLDVVCEILGLKEKSQ